MKLTTNHKASLKSLLRLKLLIREAEANAHKDRTMATLTADNWELNQLCNKLKYSYCVDIATDDQLLKIVQSLSPERIDQT